MMHGGGWWSLLNASSEQPQVSWALLRRVLRYAAPYRRPIAGMLALILASTGLTLLTPLIMRQLIDQTLPRRDLRQLVILAASLLVIPALGGFIGVGERWLNSKVGEGVIYDLRLALYAHLQRLSLRFFTNTRLGELMSRLNNDVIGAQNAISNTIVSIITNLIQAVAVAVVMINLEWRLMLISVAVLPLFLLAARRLAGRLRAISREQMNMNAHMNAMMNETLSISGALLVKLFGRTQVEVDRFDGRAARVGDLGVQRAVMGAVFFIIVGLLAAVEDVARRVDARADHQARLHVLGLREDVERGRRGVVHGRHAVGEVGEVLPLGFREELEARVVQVRVGVDESRNDGLALHVISTQVSE